MHSKINEDELLFGTCGIKIKCHYLASITGWLNIIVFGFEFTIVMTRILTSNSTFTSVGLLLTLGLSLLPSKLSHTGKP